MVLHGESMRAYPSSMRRSNTSSSDASSCFWLCSAAARLVPPSDVMVRWGHSRRQYSSSDQRDDSKWFILLCCSSLVMEGEGLVDETCKKKNAAKGVVWRRASATFAFHQLCISLFARSIYLRAIMCNCTYVYYALV